MTSVIEKVASLELDPIRQLAEERLREAQRALDGEDSAKFSSNASARLAKLSALTDLDSFEGIVDFANPKAYTAELSYYAYALYRLGQLEKLRDAVTQHESPSICSKLALAQAEYNANNLDVAFKLLEVCSSEVLKEDLGDINVNISAIQALQGTNEVGRNSSDSFDEAFNKATHLLSRGLSTEALRALQEANGLAEEEEDRQAAIAQAAYAHLIAGNKEEASKLLNGLSSSRLPLALNLVVENNKLSSSYEGGDIVDAHKALLHFDEFSKKKSKLELNATQRQIIQRNQLKLLAHVGISSVGRKAKQHQREFPSDFEPLSVALYKSNSSRGLRRMANNGNLAAKLCLAALEDKSWNYTARNSANLDNGHLDQLERIVSQVLEGNGEAVKGCLSNLPSSNLNEAGAELLHPTDEVSDDLLTSIERMVGSVDVKRLNEKIPKTNSPGVSSLASRHNRKRTGKRKLPQSFDPERTPDPERWLAKQDRSDFKPKKKKNSQATQGSSAVVEEKFSSSKSQVVGAKLKKKSKKKGKK